MKKVAVWKLLWKREGITKEEAERLVLAGKNISVLDRRSLPSSEFFKAVFRQFLSKKKLEAVKF